MSRCFCCNNILTPRELTRKFKVSKEYTEMCTTCLGTIDVPTIDSDTSFEEENDEEE